MNEDQANDMLDCLEKISKRLVTITSRLDAVEERLSRIDSNTNSTYDLGDVCSRLDDVISAIQNID